MTTDDLTAENNRRRAVWAERERPRRDLECTEDMSAEQIMERCRDDFEYWCARCVRIHDKLTGRIVPLILNYPQRRVVAVLERDRRAGRPMRVIILKARQWGGSTVVQMYMAWLQCVHLRNWNSMVCAHSKSTAATLRGMIAELLRNYPPELWDSDDPKATPELKCYERMSSTLVMNGRGNRITIATAENQDAARGLDIAMAHLSEVAYWRDTPQRSGEDFARAICSGILLAPMTFIAYESTANGVGNYFHTEWLRAEYGKSDKRPVFVPWYEIALYRMAVDDPASLWEQLDDYERALWHDREKCVTLEMLQWYHNKRREYATHEAMMAEYPTDPVEAFAATGKGIFDPRHIERLRAECTPPAARGEVALDSNGGFDNRRTRARRAGSEPHFQADSRGGLEIWEYPEGYQPSSGRRSSAPPSVRYIVAVDVGGRSAGADWSVVAALAVPLDPADASDVPRIAAQWRGHCDHDILAWKALAIARFYNQAMLVIESNTLETEHEGDTAFILEQVAEVYPNLYYRTQYDHAGAPLSTRPGFHTNRSTKGLCIETLMQAVRDGTYLERCTLACDELATYERHPNGSYAARAGAHDDILMTRAIALYVAR